MIPIEIWTTLGSCHVTAGDISVARENVLPLQPTTPPLDSYLMMVVLRPDGDLNSMDSEVEQSRVHTMDLPLVSVASTSSRRLHGGEQAATQLTTVISTHKSRI